MNMNRVPRSLIGDSLSFAFNAIFENILPWIGMCFAFLGFTILGYMVFGIVAAITYATLGIWIYPDEINISVLTPPSFPEALFFLLIMIGVVWFFFTYSASMILGFIRTMLNFYNTSVVRFRPLFNPRQVASCIAAHTIIIVLMMGGFLLFIIPGIIVLLRTMFAIYFIADKNMGPFEAINASWDLTRDKAGVLLGLSIIIFLINLVPIVGWLMTSLMKVYVYEELGNPSIRNPEFNEGRPTQND